MYKKSSAIQYSPSDLTRHMDSPFASWMARYVIECPEQAPAKDPEDALMLSLQQKGFAHEDTLEAELKQQGHSLIKIEGSSSQDKFEKTVAAMKDGLDVIVQARLEFAEFSGYADFLRKVPGDSLLGNYHYEVWDTKLSNKVKPTYLMQLCCYAEMLESIQGVIPENIKIVLGNGEYAQYKSNDFYYYYCALKKSFLAAQESFDSNAKPDPAASKSWGSWSNYAEQLLIEKDHLFQTATITRGQIKNLNLAGIITMQQLVDSAQEYVKGINPAVFQRLKAQAGIQKASVGQSIPQFKVLQPAAGEKMGLALLPPHSSLDVFFDIEGYPLDDGGLEYLWGNTYFDESGQRAFKDFWAHDSEQEKQTFIAFIEWVYERWQRDPAMHIYHYANYEIAACRKLMGRYGVCEYEVDQLLRNEVFVDLYKLFKGGVILGEPRYSIKNVEHLYRGKRETEVGNGSDSVVVYEQWRELHERGEEGATWQDSKVLNDIRDYNIDDCDSTLELVEWLRIQQAECGIAYLGKTDVTEPETKEEITERTQLRDRLLQQAEQQRSDGKLETAALTENLAWVLEFHRREAKPVFWRLFDRLGLSHVELLDDLDCLACCERTLTEAFKPTPRARNLAYEYRFDPEQEFKGANRAFYLLGIENDEGGSIKVTYLKEASDLENGLIVLQAKAEPPAIISLVPDEYINPNPIPQAIDQVVGDYENDLKTKGEAKHSAIIDFLKRARPVIKDHSGGAIISTAKQEEPLQQIINAIKNLDNSYLPIQGPPGAGKSYTGKHVIAELLKTGAKIGISSNSHKAINNLLLSAAEYCNEKGINATFACTSDTEPALAENGVSILKNNQLANHIEAACVIGTTAWGFARDDMADELDYLFVDEAGQVSIANLIAMSRSANNLILMGDQMQLGQPSQGTHPAESGLSILDYLLHDTPTISDEMGVFLGTTYRMHSALNQFISKHIYEGKLNSHPDTDKRIIKVPESYADTKGGQLNKEAGIIFIPVEHEGNTQAAEEEVAAIQNIAKELLGRQFEDSIDKHNTITRPITWNDILFVAPYNHQVSKLKQALGEDAKVGSVDKFQGQEAPIIILSMCTSDPSESPRGIDFLFDKHRINVAISRAQCLAIVVANPKIGNTGVNQIEQLKLVNLFNGLVEDIK